jgi:hypothetical protein
MESESRDSSFKRFGAVVETIIVRGGKNESDESVKRRSAKNRIWAAQKARRRAESGFAPGLPDSVDSESAWIWIVEGAGSGLIERSQREERHDQPAAAAIGDPQRLGSSA